MARKKHQEQGDVLTEERTSTKEPPMYRVLLLNDDYTSMEFVVMILESIFRKSHTEAKNIMLAVHENGWGLAGIYTKEVSETKIAQVHALARQNEYPLKCKMEPA